MIAGIIYPFIVLAVTLAHAYWHSYRVEKKNELIKSWRKGAEFLFVVVVLYFSFKRWIPTVPLLAFVVLTRAAFYDPSLNIFRGKSWLYEGEISSKKSWIDWIEDKIGVSTRFLRIAYFIVYIVYVFIYFKYIL